MYADATPNDLSVNPYTQSWYNDAGQLWKQRDPGSSTVAYSYLANSPLVQNITFKQSGTLRMTTTKSYDYLNRLSSIASSNGVAFAYSYNAANQRTGAMPGDASYWICDCDSLGHRPAPWIWRGWKWSYVPLADGIGQCRRIDCGPNPCAGSAGVHPLFERYDPAAYTQNYYARMEHGWILGIPQ